VKRPLNLTYGVDDVPPLGVTLLSGAQHVAVMSTFLIFPALVAREARVPAPATVDILSLSMLALGVAAVLPALRRGPVGAGFLCPANFTVAYVGPSLLAATAGGLGLVAGMTIFAGLVEAALARILRHLRAFFPSEVAGVVVAMVGVTTGVLGVRHLLGVGAPEPAGARELAVAAVSLGTMLLLNVWTTGAIRVFCALVGVLVGYGAAALTGILTPVELHGVVLAPLVSVPSLGHLGWSFDVALAPPFAAGAIAACLKTIGNVTTCQRINDADWTRPEMRSIGRGVLADALGTVTAGMLGTVGVNSSPTAVGLASATGVTSRRVAWAIGGIFLALAFLPRVGSALAIMPRPVVGAVLVFAACFVFVNGLQIVTSRLLDARRTFVIGLSFMAGLAVDLFPGQFAALPDRLQPLFASDLVLTMLSAMLLNLVFRLGIRRTGRLVVDRERPDPTAIEEFMEAQGAAWGARRDVIDRASFNLAQSVETIVEGGGAEGPLEIAASFDEFNLDVRVSYAGPPLELPEKRPTNEEIMASDEGQRRLAGFMLRRHADRVQSTHRAGRSTILFHFDH
jgi:NCS2 family nucleobase:cation symporter-2